MMPHRHVRVVRAATADAPLVHRIMREAFAEYDGILQPPSGALRESVADVERTMAQGGAVLAWLGDVAAGSARYLVRADDLYVERVAVLPAYRGQGLAAQMMGTIEAQARRLARSRVEVGVRQSLPRNVALYQRLGYTVVKVEPHSGGPDHTVTLVKQLI